MDELIAALPMYDFPEVASQTDHAWIELCVSLLALGIEVRPHLVRRNGDMPAVPGGIRNFAGKVVADDPASLDPEAFDLPVLWRHPRLLFAQTCWGPMEQGLRRDVEIIGQPDYSAYEGGRDSFYSSAIVMRAEGHLKAPADGAASLPLNLMRGKRFAFNGPDSMSGMIGISRDLDATGEGIAIFSGLVETGSHRASARAVVEEQADICALDCRTWAFIRTHEAFAARLAVVGWTSRRKGLPYICSRHIPAEVVTVLRHAVSASRASKPGVY